MFETTVDPLQEPRAVNQGCRSDPSRWKPAAGAHRLAGFPDERAAEDPWQCLASAETLDRNECFSRHHDEPISAGAMCPLATFDELKISFGTFDGFPGGADPAASGDDQFGKEDGTMNFIFIRNYHLKLLEIRTLLILKTAIHKLMIR